MNTVKTKLFNTINISFNQDYDSLFYNLFRHPLARNKELI